MPDNGLFGGDQLLDHLSKAHFSHKKIFCLLFQKVLLFLLLGLDGHLRKLVAQGLSRDLRKGGGIGSFGFFDGCRLGVLRVVWLLGLGGALPSKVVTFGPALDEELVTVFLEFGEDVGTLLVLDGDFTCELALQGMGFHLEGDLLVLACLVSILYKFVYCLHLKDKLLRTGLAHVSKETGE